MHKKDPHFSFIINDGILALISVRREINLMRRLSHPHVVRLFEVIETTSEIYMVMEYVNSGELFYYLTEKGRLQEDEGRYLFQQVRGGIITYANKEIQLYLVALTNKVKLFCNARIDNFRY